MFSITLSDIIIMSDRVVRRNENMSPIAVSGKGVCIDGIGVFY